MNQKFILPLFFLCCISELIAQTSDQPVNLDVFPPSPNIAALFKFVNQPVNLATGVPEVNIPIYDFKAQSSLKLNVSLQYHAGGIAVEEISSDIGIGWALSAGGTIARVVRGIPDDSKGLGYFYMHGISDPALYLANYCGLGLMCPHVDSVEMFYHKNIDSQADIFSYSFGGKSGKFVFGLDGSVLKTPQSAIRIERILDPSLPGYKSLAGFKITDTDGTVYYFNESEDMKSLRMGFSQNPSGIFDYSSSWHISKIVDAYKTDSISFSYSSTYIEYRIGYSQSDYVLRNSPYDYNVTKTYADSREFLGTIKRVASISLPDNTKVTFNYNSVSRKDINSPGSLKEIIISNGRTYGYRLYQSYGSSLAYDPPPPSVSSAIRLRLDSISQFSGSLQIPPYRFSYNELLPDRLSSAQDFWGYAYNPVRTNSTTLVPRVFDGLYNTYDGADRRADSVYVKCGSLIKITYPTGGTTEFEYEVNRAGDGKLTQLMPITKNITSGSTLFTGSKTFTVNRYTTSDQIRFDFKLLGWCPGVPTTCHMYFNVTSLDGTLMYASAEFINSELGTTKSSPNITGFTNGDYKINFSASPGGCTCNDPFLFNLSWVENILDASQLVGGLRIKKMSNYDGIDHRKDIVKVYEYKKNNGTSSGVIKNKPRFDFNYKEIEYTMSQLDGGLLVTCFQTDNNFYVRSTDMLSSLNVLNGSPIIYTQVTVKDLITSGTIGKTVYRFSSDFQASDPCIGCQVGNNEMSLDYGLGLPISEEYFNQSGTKVKSIRKQFNILSFSKDSAKYRSFTLGLRESRIQPPDAHCAPHYLFKTHEYFPVTGRVEKTKETVTTYSSSTDSLVVDNYFIYDQVYFHLNSSYFINSIGQKIETRNYYATDYSLGGAIANLRAKRAYDVGISNEQWIIEGGVERMMKGSITEYQILSTQIVRPLRKFTFESSTPVLKSVIGAFDPSTLVRNSIYFKEQENYTAFDLKGNLKEVINRQGVSRTILWDYNYQHPTAEIIDASNDNYAYTSFEGDNKGNWIILGQAVSDMSSPTGHKCFELSSLQYLQRSGISSTSKYTVSFWYKSGSSVTVNGGVQSNVVSRTGKDGWTLKQMDITGTSNITIQGMGFIDEVRIYPVSSQMTTYTFDLLFGVISVTGVDNKTIYYEYDDFGRLKLQRDFNGHIQKAYKYNYKKH